MRSLDPGVQQDGSSEGTAPSSAGECPTSFLPGSHGATFWGGPSKCASGLAVTQPRGNHSDCRAQGAAGTCVRVISEIHPSGGRLGVPKIN